MPAHTPSRVVAEHLQPCVLRALARDRSGVSAIEFALLAPLLIVIFMGLADLFTAVMTQLHVDHAAEETADIVSENQVLTPTNGFSTSMLSMFQAAGYVLEPYSSTPLDTRITSYYYDGVASHLYAKVYWSCGTLGLPPYTATPANSTTNPITVLPGSGAAINNVLAVGNTTAINTSIIVVETHYNFTSPTGQIINGVHIMSGTFALQPRFAGYVGVNWSGSSTVAPTAPALTTMIGTPITIMNGGSNVATCNYVT
jgi:Flp pilus assembly protein TadG